MNLSRKALIIIGTTVFCFIAVLYIASRMIVLRSFEDLQLQHIQNNVLRAHSALWAEILSLDTLVHDWSVWDDTYRFIQDTNEGYREANLKNHTFINAHLNSILFFDVSGRMVFGKALDLQTLKEIPVPQSILSYLNPHSELLNHPDTESSVKGIILLPEGPLLVASRPIVTSENKGPIRGTLIMAQYLDPFLIEHLQKTSLLTIDIRLADGPLPDDFQTARTSLIGENQLFSRQLQRNIFAGYCLVNDIYGKPALIMKVEQPGTIYQQGKATLVLYVGSLVVFGLLFTAVILALLHRVIIQRLVQLSTTLTDISINRDFSARLPVSKRDEVSTLALTANEMLSSLERSHQEVLEREEQLRQLSSQLLHSQENERKRVANEIHDNAGQVLAAIKYRVESALLKVQKSGCGDAFQPIKELVPLVQNCIEDMRRLQTELRPSMLDEMGLLATIRWFCRQFELTYPSIRLEKDLTADESDIPEELKIVIFRIIQEALNNAGKYSDASVLSVLLEENDGTNRLRIADNGRGFNLEEAQTIKAFGKGLGLSSMRERVQFSGGTLSIVSTIGHGTRIEARWPKNALAR